MPDDLFSTAPAVLTVSALNRFIRELLESSVPLLWVEGELSNLTRAASGHWYFSLKDTDAQVRCVMFRGKNQLLDWQPREGDHVEALARVTLYEARGEFQLTVEQLRRAGLGALYVAFEQLKAKLQAEGLFDAANKRPLPAHPKRIGIVTSPDAAALRDVLTTLRRRMPSIPVVIYPTPVQGKGAAPLIASAIRKASERAECDVLIVCRGGGSIEDLWPFNEEIVARAIAACPIPVVCGVGHETDFTIADFAADVRAPTPTAAAELVSPDRAALHKQIALLEARLVRQMRHALSERAQTLDHLAQRLVCPESRIRQQKEKLEHLKARLSGAMRRLLENAAARLEHQLQSLELLNPRHILERGYSVITDEHGNVIRSSAQLSIGQTLNLTFGHGHASARVVSTRDS
ncbi:MAG: exodeoxyribonuclease VII large subunit [Methylophilaceae bacterium]|nr:exodeoxyribonuclease VII large subunit [Methylophilaceae bacterium]